MCSNNWLTLFFAKKPAKNFSRFSTLFHPCPSCAQKYKCSRVEPNFVPKLAKIKPDQKYIFSAYERQIYMTISIPKELRHASWMTAFFFLLSLPLWANRTLLDQFSVSAALPLHTALETATIVIYCSVFIVCWNAFGEFRRKSSTILAVAFLCTAIFGFFHAISFQGMPGFLNSSDMHKSLSFWLISRYVVALTLFGLALLLGDSAISTKTSFGILLASLFVTILASTVIFQKPDLIPLTYRDGFGQTNVKIAGELGLIILNLITSFLIYRQVARPAIEEDILHLHIKRAYLFLASALMAMSEVYFLLDRNTDSVLINVGHVFQLFSALAIYRSMVAVNIHAPYETLIDASERLTQSSKDLSIHKQRLAGIIDTAIDGIMTINSEQNILLLNPSAAAIFGYHVSDLMGVSLNKVIPDRHRKVHGSHIAKFGDTGATKRKMGNDFEDFYVTGLRADGTEFPIEASISSLLEEGQRYYTVIFRDITERKLAKERTAQYHIQLSQLSMALQNIREEERKHIARELHDDLGQLLAALRMDLSLLQRDHQVTEKSHKILNSMDQLILTSITTLRRIATDLRPRALDEGGLFFALQNLQKDFSNRHGVDCELIADEEQLILNDERSTAIFRIIQESLTNVARHANATEVQIEFHRNETALSLKISDNGRGIGKEDMLKSRSFGLVGMRERIKVLQGEFTISSTSGEGTCLEVSIPLINND